MIRKIFDFKSYRILSRIVVIGILSLCLFSCNKTKNPKEPDVSSVKIDIQSENLDQQLFSCKSVEDVQIFLEKHPYLNTLYFPDAGMNGNQLANQLFMISQNPDFRQFKGQMDSLIGDRNTVILQPLADAFKNIKYYYPGFQAPKVKFMVTGFAGNDLYVSDSLIIIGLDYFAGPSARFRPDVYDYQLARYQKDHIVPSVIFFMAAKYDKINSADHTLLSDMIGFGKDFMFTKKMLPKTPESLILGFSEDNLQRIHNSQTDIWAYFIAGKLLYEKTELIKQKYVGDRPFTAEIGNKVPGGIGRWIGWRIVSKYMKEHPEVTLQELMQMDNSVNLLQESGYNGQKDEED